MNCPNCQARLSCGCQKRTASDGKQVCTNCIAAYEASKTSAKKDDQVLTVEQQIRIKQSNLN